MKKIISLVLSVCLLCALFVTPALAGTAYNSDVTLSASLDKSELTVSSSAQTVVLTVSTSKAVDLFSIGYSVAIPEGWSINSISSGSSINYSGYSSTTTGFVSWFDPMAENKSASTIGVISVSVPANTPAGNYSIGVSGVELATEGQNNDNAWMTSGSASAQLTIKAPKALSSISVKTAPTKTSYIAGQNFDPTGLVITATYNDGTTAEKSSGWTITDGNNLTTGKTSVTISYTEGGVTKTTSQAITVAAKALTGISVKTAPTKTSYIAGQNFDPAGLVITATYNDGTTADKTSGWTITDGSNLTTDKTSVTISYTESDVTKTTTQAITVSPKALTGISVKTAPSKTSYIAGQNFDPAGLVITATYNDGTTADKTSGWTITDGSNLTTGKTSVTISYTESGVAKTTTQAITVTAKAVSSIAVKTQPAKTVYNAGENFNAAGMVITVTYNDGSSEDVSTGFTVSPSGALATSNTTVTISYGGKTATVNITVNAVSVTGVSLNKSSTTIKVGRSETLTATVAPANATNKNVAWSSSNTSVATVNQYGIVTGVAEGTATITVTTADGGKTATCSVTVEKSSTPVNPPVNPPVDPPKPIDEGCPKDSTCPMAAFSDLNMKLWYHDGIHFCLEEGLMNGVGGGKFDPNGTTTRAMIVTILWRLEGEPVANYAMSFKDVPSGQWYTEAVRWAQANNIVEGYSADKFGPDDIITREQLATILYRYAKLKGKGFSGEWKFPLDFVDTAKISSWADEAVHWCSMKGIVNGKDGKVFDPQGKATRAEAAAMIQRFCER